MLLGFLETYILDGRTGKGKFVMSFPSENELKRWFINPDGILSF